MKTPEQMADEYAEFGLQGVPDSIRKQLLMTKDRMAFLAGYQAAINSPEKPDSCEHILDMEKMVDADKVINGNTSDGYHTFNELYEHRHYLFIALIYALQNQGRTWISSKHADKSSFDESFIAGINLPTGPITYHLPNRLWIACVGAEAKVLDQAPPWDGHTSTDVLNRLARYSAGICDEVAPPFVDKVMNSSNNSNGWISVKERLPEEDVAVLTYGQVLNNPPEVIGVRRRYNGDQEWKHTWESEDGFIYREDDITHWMPLPEPPKEEA